MKSSGLLILCRAALLVLAFGVVSPALALDAYWHGVRSSNWQHGPLAGVSNWYSQPPPMGQTRGVPDENAIFDDDAQRLTVIVTKPTGTSIGTMSFTAVEDGYLIVVNKKLEVLTSPGVRVPALARIPLFRLNAQMILRGRTNTGRADYAINADGILELTFTRGVANNLVLSANRIANNGRLILFKNRMNLNGPYLQRTGSFMTLTLGNDHSGVLKAPSVTLAGTLVVKSNPALALGDYGIIRAGQRIGRFTSVSFQGFAANVIPSVVYYGANGNVDIRVRAKP